MRLKSIKLAGFKSFVDPTTVPFPQALTAIVGPNGCGKSNIIDAVRWVLGESSAKNLRGDSMTDVIFNGALERQPVSQASVELIFDNQDGRLSGEFANYNEIAIKRQVNRDRQNIYFLNGSKCRRRDITDIFLGTGLGPRSYAIIEQGMISRLIESKPRELRVFIEEAAGISKYKERRRETETRLRHSRENLDRLNDVRQELGQQISKLHRQSTAAQRYKTLKADERRLKAELSAIRWLNWQSQYDDLATKIEDLNAQIEGFEVQRITKQSQQSELQVELDTLSLSHTDAQQKLFEISHSITRLEQQIVHHNQHQHRIQQELDRIQTELTDQAEFIDQQQQESVELEQEAELLDEQLAESELIQEELSCQFEQAEHALLRYQSQSKGHVDAVSDVRHQLERSTQQSQLLKQQQSQVQQRITQIERQKHALSNDTIDRDLEQKTLQISDEQAHVQQLTEDIERHRQILVGYEAQYAQSQQAQQQRQQELSRLQGQQATLTQWLSADDEWNGPIKGQTGLPVADLLRIEPGWEKAVEVALGSLSHALQIETDEIELDDLPNGKSVMLPLPDKPSNAWHGTLAEKVEGHEGVQQLLSTILVAESNEQFWRIQRQLIAQRSVMLITGVWAGQIWIKAPEQAQGQYAIRAQLQRIQQQIDAFQTNLDSAQQAVTEASEKQQQQAALLVQVQQQSATIAEQLQRLNTERELLVQKILLQSEQSSALQHEHDEGLVQLESLEQALMMNDEEHEEFTARLERANVQYGAFEAELQQRQERVGGHRAQRDQQLQQHHQLVLQQSANHARLDSAQQALIRAQQQKEQGLKRQLELSVELEQGENDEQMRLELELQLAARIEAQQHVTSVNDAMNHAQNQLIELKHAEQKLYSLQQSVQQQRDSLLLEQQTASVRAQSATEQLHEMEQPLKAIVESLPVEFSESQWQQDLEKIAKSVVRLGPINLAAIEEYEQSVERKTYLDQQNDDLVSALDTLENAIRRIDRECRTRFKDTFERVNSDLKFLFPKVFGGGAAYLELTDDDMLDTGVTIMARPPGKRNATIHLLSGGEKALTALSLVFAIFRLNPAPFCMLDEVDAPLDDANVGRFCNLVREMAETVQFIYISHNKVTMEMAEQLSGVTMNEPGVSRLVSVDVDEAVALAEVS
ncbi:chromosome segregation protein SMC [Echinimonas agarilytica]|uniref:Chromosome partition protein Smc n=1 Tax=Echinimonas agarilytica TaxID=1215918 RepID=A0AA42B704_9GAMM|nr:chromosome segregation protein SMC [Echinimonas agarilytica]MCM2679315.1 chromosome segregation protein SMC [Echinimonas agarilytica]